MPTSNIILLYVYVFVLIDELISSLKNAAAKKAKTLENDDSQKLTEKDGINAKKSIVKKTMPSNSNDGAESNNENEMEVTEEDKDDVAEDEDEDAGDGVKAENEIDNSETIKTDAMDIDKMADAEKDDKKKIKTDDNKEKRKKFVRLWCVHCRIECATFKVK